MGASTSFVSVQLERPYYYPGEVLTGVLCLNVLKPLEARHLEVTVHGVEKTHWTGGRGRGVMPQCMPACAMTCIQSTHAPAW